MLRIQPRQETFRGDQITALNDNGDGTVDCTLNMDERVVTITETFADMSVGDWLITRDIQGGAATWEWVTAALFAKYLKVQGG